MKRLFAVSLLIFALTCAFSAPALADEKRLEALGEEFIIFEAGLAHLKHCDDFKAHQKKHPGYLRNATEAIDMLAREIVAENKGKKIADAMNDIMAQKTVMAEEFETFYADKNACKSEEAKATWDHIEAFQDMPIAKFRQYLKSKIINPKNL